MSCDVLKLEIIQQKIVFSTENIFGDSDISIKSCSKMIENYHVLAPISAKYRLSLVKHGLKSLSFSVKVSVRVDSRDILCIQHMVQTDGEGNAYTEFYCVPDKED
ncbi:cell cycle checkpoint protein RAD1 [Eurytemora carolleeae]|uniref:cell cycle checkpoint protein RAD1 n=1 Tax=Eurytemora carolleeae TaxID=1294199 RepID=UPI000C7926D1|nr:cell cycle checkpoint protein RAD1 [Eurytemora carolleeae]|eukprot:XP_023344962.1 cell cycle checkpoint protein RAD1-like [Eurytemora affinis]